jgi:uncharacterized membrane protein YjfL (UPF0719 family)
MISIDLNLVTTFFLDLFVQFGVVVSTIFIATKWRSLITFFGLKKDGYQSNIAVTITTLSFYISLVLIIVASIGGNSLGYFYDLVSITSTIILGILFLSFNRVVISKLYLKGLNGNFELDHENIAFSIFQSGILISISTIFFLSFSQFPPSFGLLAIGIFSFIVTQTLFHIFAKLSILLAKYDEVREIQKGNIAVSIDFLTTFLSFSILLGSFASAIFEISISSITATLIYSLISISMLFYIPNLITSLIISGNKSVENSIEDGNIIIAVKAGAIKIIIAFLILETIPSGLTSF